LKSSGSSHSFAVSRFSLISSGLRRLLGLFRGFKRLLQFDRPSTILFVNLLFVNDLSSSNLVAAFAPKTGR
jgi:hypothetical protein